MSPSTAYLLAVTAAVVGSMAWQWFADVLPGILTTAASEASGGEAGRGRTSEGDAGGGGDVGGTGLAAAFALAWGLVAAGALAVALRATGPIALSRPVLTWCLGSATVSRALHRRALGRPVLASTAVALLASVAATLVTWPLAGWGERGSVWLGAVVVGGALVAITAAEQTGPGVRTGGLGTGTDSLGTGTDDASASRAAGTATALGGLLLWYGASLGLVTVSPAQAGALAAALGAATVLLGALRWRHLRAATDGESIPVGELGRAADVVGRLLAATVTLTPLQLEPVPRPRRPIRFPSGPGVVRGRPAWLALADARRALARWPELVTLAALVPLAASVTRLAGDGWGVLVLTLVAYHGACRLARWFLAWDASPTLRSLVPFDDRATAAALLVTPALGVLVLAGLAVALAGLPPWLLASCLLCALLGVDRRRRAERGPDDAALWLATPLGAVPVALVGRLAAGWDVAILGGLLGAAVVTVA